MLHSCTAAECSQEQPQASKSSAACCSCRSKQRCYYLRFATKTRTSTTSTFLVWDPQTDAERLADCWTGLDCRGRRQCPQIGFPMDQGSSVTVELYQSVNRWHVSICAVPWRRRPPRRCPGAATAGMLLPAEPRSRTCGAAASARCAAHALRCRLLHGCQAGKAPAHRAGPGSARRPRSINTQQDCEPSLPWLCVRVVGP